MKRQRIWSVLVLAALGCALAACTPGDDDDATDDDVVDDDDADEPPWWQRVVFMEIFPRSYADSDNDGIGDLAGLTQRLPHIAELGVGAIWLTPIYPTPFVDSGYDVADYCSINPDYGSMQDFEIMLARAHELGLRVLLDGVFNHTSDRHWWFAQSRSSRDDPKRDWYIWSDQPGFDCHDPFGAHFGEERWTLDPSTGQYFFHYFRPGMPDLNWDNPEVQQAILDVVRFWLDKGVDGFRLDVAHLYFQDAQSCAHHPKTHEFLSRLRGLVDSYGERMLVGEVSGMPEEVVQYLGQGDDELHMILNFPLDYGLVASLLTGNALPAQIMLDMTWGNIPPGGWHGVHISNHDFYRYHGLLGQNDRRTKMASALQLSLPGSPFVYYGEEVGMANGKQVLIDYRDAARTPMHWDNGTNAGFSDVEPWIALAENYADHNVAVESADPGSLLNHFRRIIALRNVEPALQTGAFRVLWTDDFGAYCFFRGRDEQAVLAVFNLSPRTLGLELELRGTEWDGLTGRVLDLYSGREYLPLLPENQGAYPLALEPYGFALLKPESL